MSTHPEPPYRPAWPRRTPSENPDPGQGSAPAAPQRTPPSPGPAPAAPPPSASEPPDLGPQAVHADSEPREHPTEPPHPAPARAEDKMELFASLLATCQRKVFLYIMALVHNPTDAEEILQETNLILWRKFEQYRPGTDFAQWACRVAYYEVLKYREKRAKQEHLFSTQFLEQFADEVENFLQQADLRREALTGCVQKLRHQDRQLLWQRYQPTATTRSVAEALGRSIQGTRKSLHRIRTTLLECIRRTLARELR